MCGGEVGRKERRAGGRAGGPAGGREGGRGGGRGGGSEPAPGPGCHGLLATRAPRARLRNQPGLSGRVLGRSHRALATHWHGWPTCTGDARFYLSAESPRRHWQAGCLAPLRVVRAGLSFVNTDLPDSPCRRRRRSVEFANSSDPQPTRPASAEEPPFVYN